MKRPANRVAQLDSSILDDNVIQYFEAELDNVAQVLRGGVTNKIYIVLKRLLISLYNITKCVKGRTPGDFFMNIGCFDTKTNVLICNYIISSLLRNMLEAFASIISSQQMLKITEKLLALISLVDFVHHFYFLNQGGPAKVMERVLQINTSYKSQPMLGRLNYDGLNREMIGHSFGHFCVLVAPLIQYTKFKIKSERLSKSFNSYSSSSAIECNKCCQYAVLPVKFRDDDESELIMCYYCCMLSNNAKQIEFCNKT